MQVTQSPTIFIPDSFKGYPIASFCLQHVPAKDLDSVLIPGGLVRDRIERLGLDISTDVAKDEFVFLCVLKGAFQFFNQLIEVVRQHHKFNVDFSAEATKTKAKARRIQTEFIRLVSYEDDASTGSVRIIGLENLSSLKGKNVIVVEDIVDSGATIQTLLNALESEQPKSVRVAALFFKRTVKNTSNYCPDCEYSNSQLQLGAEFEDNSELGHTNQSHHLITTITPSHADVGFSIPDSFIVGYNLDYNNYFRDLQVSDSYRTTRSTGVANCILTPFCPLTHNNHH